jgi:glutamyl-tRNA reductase
MLHVGALAVDFRASSMGMRDKLYLEKDRLTAFLHAMPDDAPLYEIVALCTCNRIEIFYVCEDHGIASEWLGQFLASFHKIPLTHLKSTFTNYCCEDAVRHIFRVASGVESMVFGEHEILGQIRESYFHCLKNQTTDSYLNRLFQQAIATGKQVRSQTAAGRGALSIASIAVERMGEIAGDVREKRILVIGVGTMGFRALKRLSTMNCGKIGISNRTDERAERYSKYFNAEHVPFNQIIKELNGYNIILLATSSEQHILKADEIAALCTLKERHLLIIDLGAPRNADPAIGLLPNVTLVCIDDLRETAEKRLGERKKELAEIEYLVELQVDEFKRWYKFRIGCECKTE